MTYTPNTPQTGNSLGFTRPIINSNFQVLNTSNSVNHVAFGLADQGKHKFLQMPEQGSAPTTAVNEGGLYTKVGTNPAETNLFFRAEGSGFEYQITKSIAASTARFATLNNGWTFLPGGLLLQYGVVNSPAATGTVLFTTSNIDFPQNLFSVFFNFRRNASGTDSFWIDSTQTFDKTRFSWKASTSTALNLYWVAIGN